MVGSRGGRDRYSYSLYPVDDSFPRPPSRFQSLTFFGGWRLGLGPAEISFKFRFPEEYAKGKLNASKNLSTTVFGSLLFDTDLKISLMDVATASNFVGCTSASVINGLRSFKGRSTIDGAKEDDKLHADAKTYFVNSIWSGLLS
jgi:hypothetical protein